MPLYDYKCSNGCIVTNVFSKYGEHEFKTINNQVCKQVWLKAPGVSIPLHHQSAPKEDPDTVRLSKLAEDPNSSVRVLEAGMNRDVERTRKERVEQDLKWIDNAVKETMIDYSNEIKSPS